MTVTGGRTVYELRGNSCLGAGADGADPEGNSRDRSFEAPVTSWREGRDGFRYSQCGVTITELMP